MARVPISPRQYADKRFASLKSERNSFLSHWQEIAQFINPRRGRFLVENNNKGGKRNGKIIDNTGIEAKKILTSGLMSGLSSPARPWFRLDPQDPALREIDAVKEYLSDVEREMYRVLAGSNFYKVIGMVYGEAGQFGTGAMSILDDFENTIHCHAFTAGEYMIATDDKDNVNTFYREVRKTVSQLEQDYGLGAMSRQSRQLWENGNLDHWVTVRQGIEPNRNQNARGLFSGNMLFQSIHWEVGSSTEEGFLRKKGFMELPIMAPRWETASGDVYGTGCPGMDALGDVKQLQSEQKDKGIGIQKMVDPSMVGSGALKNAITNTLPGGMTLIDGMSGGSIRDNFAQAQDIRISLADMTADIREVQFRIMRAFYADLFQRISIDDKVRTATTDAIRDQERLLQLGPLLPNIKSDLHDPALGRVFAIMDRKGMFPDPPEELDGTPLKVEYIGPLAQAQKQVAAAAMDRMLGVFGTVAQADPSALDKLDADQYVDSYAEALGVPPEIVRSAAETAAIRQAREQQERLQQFTAQMEPISNSLKNLSAVDTGGDNLVANALGTNQ